MLIRPILLATTALLAATPALAEAAPDQGQAAASLPEGAAAKPANAKTFSTGVAKGRDLLDSAISASTIDEADLPKLGTSAVAGIIGNLPGIRAETSGIDGFSSLTVRGLPLAADGSKYLQIQEDGLPVLEFGDIHFGSADQFLRADIGLSQVQVIRGGSASTFASNSPGGLINFISKTGETEGGAIQIAAGLDHDLNRVDFDYGAPLGSGWRFHVGGFYRQGEGPRDIGYTGFKGGQFKFNVTRQFANGYVRLSGKFMDDRQPNYSLYPVLIAGTNDAPRFASIPGTNALRDGLASPFTTTNPGVDQNNQPTTIDSRNGLRGKVRSLGVEAQFDVAGWTISNKFRFASIAGEYNETIPFITAPAGVVAAILGAPGGTLRFANGPGAGQPVTSPATLGGNGLLNLALNINSKTNNFDNLTNDLRASRVWPVGEGKLTTTAGIYASSQNVDMFWQFGTSLQTLGGNGTTARIDLATPAGLPVTAVGIASVGFPAALGIANATYHRRYDVNYRILAPYGSVNYQIGKLAVGASVRLDTGKVDGRLFGADLGGTRVGSRALDLNGDGSVVGIENLVPTLPLAQPGTVDFTYRYTSYSVGANYRVAEPFSVFARYSKGSRATAERELFNPSLNSATGKLTDPSVAASPVKQAEAGIKLRQNGLSLFLTGFWASTRDNTFQIAADATGQVIVVQVNRTYTAKGLELEAEVARGPFSLALGATYAKAKIDRDISDPSVVGNRPRHQPSLFFNARPQFEQGMFTLGATINGTTSSFAQDSNILKQPGYVLVSPFIAVRPAPRVQLGLNAFNVFDKLAIVNLSAAAIPASGIANVQTLTGRTITGSLRFSF